MIETSRALVNKLKKGVKPVAESHEFDAFFFLFYPLQY